MQEFIFFVTRLQFAVQYTFTSLFTTIHMPLFGVDLEPATLISDAKEPCQLTG